MAAERIFVGRTQELEQFKKVLEDPQGQAVLVVGQAGMGKTWLINKMAEIAENHPKLKCGWVRYEVTPTDSVDSTMALMMDNAFEAAQITEGSFDGTERRLEQWRSFLNVFNIGDLAMSLRRDPARNTRDQFLERLTLISRRMPENGRAIFIIDPEKYMQKESDQSWAIVVKSLPEKIKFAFAQRPEDVLVDSEVFDVLNNVVWIPGKDLDVLSDEDVHDLVQYRKAGLKCSVPDLRKVLSRYKGHPYAVGAALDLVEAGIKLEDLPAKPKPIKFAQTQWKEVCKKGKDAMRLLKAYAILEVGVPDEVVQAVGNLDTDTLQHVLADKYCGGLLREEGQGKRIYHAILADYVLGQIGEQEKKEYHGRAVKVYRDRLHRDIKPDELAATRLPEHVLVAEGEAAFVDAFINECTEPLINLGLLDAAINLSDKARGMVKKGSEEEAMVLGNLGLIYQTKGELDKAEEMFLKIVEIHKRLGSQEGLANDYGNLGLIYRMRGELDKAEEMHKKSLEIAEKLGLQEIMASDYGNLGLIYQKRGQFDKSEEMHLKALEMNEKLGRLEGIARNYGNLGVIYQKRGDLDKAEEMHKKSLEIAEKFGLQEVMANQYGNLGLIYRKRGQLDKAEEMNNKALEIAEKLGLQEVMANAYGNLGGIYQTKGELVKAEEMLNKSLEINKKLGRLEGMANQYGNLGLIYQTKGELDKAEEMLNKSLEINKKLGRLEGMAIDYGNLGVVYKRRGELDKAEGMHNRALEIAEKLGQQEVMANAYGNLGTIYQKRGDIAKAREYWEKALDLYKKIGIPQMVKKVQGWIEKANQN
jgi:tetratricopeptide (TPR) repeat protein/energy-coupling factor transporter ATP-binding protein EcfA2